MAYDSKIVYFHKKSDFEENKENISNIQIVFIEDTKEIYLNGNFFNGIDNLSELYDIYQSEEFPKPNDSYETAIAKLHKVILSRTNEKCSISLFNSNNSKTNINVIKSNIKDNSIVVGDYGGEYIVGEFDDVNELVIKIDYKYLQNIKGTTTGVFEYMLPFGAKIHLSNSFNRFVDVLRIEKGDYLEFGLKKPNKISIQYELTSHEFYIYGSNDLEVENFITINSSALYNIKWNYIIFRPSYGESIKSITLHYFI